MLPWREHATFSIMHVIAKRVLRDHWETPGREDSEQPLKSWHEVVSAAQWRSPAEVRSIYGSASFVGERVVFNIGGNKYRLVTWIDYGRQLVLIKFVGTHGEYDRIDVDSVGRPNA